MLAASCDSRKGSFGTYKAESKTACLQLHAHEVASMQLAVGEQSATLLNFLSWPFCLRQRSARKKCLVYRGSRMVTGGGGGQYISQPSLRACKPFSAYAPPLVWTEPDSVNQCMRVSHIPRCACAAMGDFQFLRVVSQFSIRISGFSRARIRCAYTGVAHGRTTNIGACTYMYYYYVSRDNMEIEKGGSGPPNVWIGGPGSPNNVPSTAIWYDFASCSSR